MAHIGFSARNFGAICRRSNIFRHSIRYVTTNNSSQNRRVLLIGSGNVVPPVVEYLGASSVLKPTVTIGSIDERAANSLAEKHERVSATYLDVSDEVALNKCVADHDAVISLVPWIFHGNVARACIANKVDMITTSYVSAEMESLHESAKDAGITILNEVGLDPGIDHLAAMKIIDDVKDRGGKITSFISFCGGLPAAEASFVPLQYKFSWSPKGVLLAGISQATYRENGTEYTTDNGRLFHYDRDFGEFPSLNLEAYPNRNSLVYEDVYGIHGAHTILRGTLRFKGFCKIMRALQALGLMENHHGPTVGSDKGATSTWDAYVAHHSLAASSGTSASASARDVTMEFLRSEGHSPADIHYIVDALEELGLFSDDAVDLSHAPIDELCAQLQRRLVYGPGERDMVLLSHQFVAEWEDGSCSDISSKLVRCGDPSGHTAMAELVGVPCALATEHVLRGTVQGAGVIRPVEKCLYEPLLADLATLGIRMTEKETLRR